MYDSVTTIGRMSEYTDYTVGEDSKLVPGGRTYSRDVLKILQEAEAMLIRWSCGLAGKRFYCFLWANAGRVPDLK